MAFARRAWSGCWSALVALSCWWHLGLAADVDEVTSGAPLLWLPAFLTWFAVGIALALAHVVIQVRAPAGGVVRLLSTFGSMPGASWVMAAALMLVVATPLGGPDGASRRYARGVDGQDTCSTR